MQATASAAGDTSTRTHCSKKKKETCVDTKHMRTSLVAFTYVSPTVYICVTSGVYKYVTGGVYKYVIARVWQSWNASIAGPSGIDKV
jgi:hypothetical protein